ncbi:MAG: hypothetical protein ACREQC_03550 [Candidatus Binataceae bacterium]
MELIAILTALTLLGLVTNWTSYQVATEAEKTIRYAIESGVVTDASSIPKLREPAGLSWVERFILLGMMMLFASGGIVFVALVLIVTKTGVPTPMFALAAFTALFGVGLIACGRWLRQTRAKA